MADFATCMDPGCGTRAKGRAAACPACAGPMRNNGASKVRGGLLLALGLFLVLFTGWIAATVLPAMLPPTLNPGDGPVFRGTAEQGRTIIGLLAALAVFGATASAYGAYMLITGRQNRAFMTLSLLLFALLAYIGWTVLGWGG